jgi:hypothetical protein
VSHSFFASGRWNFRELYVNDLVRDLTETLS